MGIGAGVAAAGIAAAGSIGGSLISASATSGAAKTQASAANAATAATQAQQAATQQSLNPYVSLGYQTLPSLESNIGAYGDSSSNSLQQAASENPGVYLPAANIPTTTALSAAAPGSMTQAQLEQTPGYQFTLAQGLQATQNSAAARGLGVSGAALKGAASYATGLADSTYKDQFAIAQQQFANQGTIFNANQTGYQDATTANQNQFNNQQQRFSNLVGLNSATQGNLTNSYNRLLGMTTLGQNAATQSASNNLAATNQAGQFATSGANASAAAQIAGGNAVQSGLNSAGNALMSYGTQQALQGQTVGSLYNNLTGATGSGSNWTPADQAAASSYNDNLGY